MNPNSLILAKDDKRCDQDRCLVLQVSQSDISFRNGWNERHVLQSRRGHGLSRQVPREERRRLCVSSAIGLVLIHELRNLRSAKEVFKNP